MSKNAFQNQNPQKSVEYKYYENTITFFGAMMRTYTEFINEARITMGKYVAGDEFTLNDRNPTKVHKDFINLHSLFHHSKPSVNPLSSNIIMPWFTMYVTVARLVALRYMVLSILVLFLVVEQLWLVVLTWLQLVALT